MTLTFDRKKSGNRGPELFLNTLVLGTLLN